MEKERTPEQAKRHQWYINRRERANAECKAYYQAHREEMLAYQKQYREAHKDKIKYQRIMYKMRKYGND